MFIFFSPRKESMKKSKMSFVQMTERLIPKQSLRCITSRLPSMRTSGSADPSLTAFVSAHKTARSTASSSRREPGLWCQRGPRITMRNFSRNRKCSGQRDFWRKMQIQSFHSHSGRLVPDHAFASPRGSPWTKWRFAWPGSCLSSDWSRLRKRNLS